MTPFRSIGRQIISAYLIFTAACCLLFILIGTIVIEAIEVRLVDDRLKEVATWAAPRHAGGLPVEMPSGLSFHHGAGIPTSLRSLPEGVQEATVDGVGLHVFGGRTPAGPFVVIDHESDYDNVEAAVYSLILASFVGFLGLSVLLGRYMARRFVSPLVELSEAVAVGRPALPLLLVNNEFGELARAFDTYAKAMQHYLDRERFFTGDVSHELRTPLTIIRGAVEILSAETEKHPSMVAPLERIDRALQDATDSVNVLLMLARAPNRIESSDISVAALAQAQVHLYQFMVEKKPVELRFEGGDFQLRVPSKLLEAAVGNLIRNACLYTERGTVTVKIVGHAIEVRDTGAGLPDAVVAMLLDEHPSTYVGSEGTGLGLALVKRICEHIGARLRFVSKPDQGSILVLDCSAVHKILTSS